MAYQIPSKLVPLGKLITTAGSPIRITSVIDASPPADGLKAFGNTDANNNLKGNKIVIQNMGSTGNVFVGLSNMNTTTLVGVLAKLAVGSVPLIIQDKMALNVYQAGDFFIDTDNSAGFAAGYVETV